MASTKKVSLKLLVDPKSNKVLFAEARKEFVDFLFQMLSLPVGTVVTLVTSEGMVGSLGRLYETFQGLNTDYLKWSNFNKQSVLNPRVGVNVPLLSLNDARPPFMTHYKCSYSGCSNVYTVYTSDGPAPLCPRCLKTMISNGSTTLYSEYVKESATYMVMDNLEVQPMSTSLVMSLINKSHVVNVGSLVQKDVEVGLTQLILSPSR